MSVAENGRPAVDADAINLLDLLLVLSQRWRLLIGLPLLFAVLAAIYALTATRIYEGTAVMMPPQQQQSSSSAMLAQLGGMGGLAGGALGLKNPNDLYVGMLRSRTVGERMVQRFDLQRAYETEKPGNALRRLAGATEIVAGKDGLITISVRDSSPKLAADLANGYVEELRVMSRGLAVTEAQQRRLFFEQQLRSARDDLAGAEVALKKVQQKTGILDVGAQSAATINALSDIKATIAAKEVELNAMRSFATAQHPDYVRVSNELAGLRVQLRKLTQGHDEGDVLIVKSRAPELSLEYVRRLRDVKYQETLFEIIAKQYELARMDEAKEGAVIQVIDKAVPPDRKVKPKGVLLVAMGLIGGFLLAVLIAFLQYALARAASGPDAHKLRELRAAFSWRRRPA